MPTTDQEFSLQGWAPKFRWASIGILTSELPIHSQCLKQLRCFPETKWAITKISFVRAKKKKKNRGWSRALIWVSVDICQVKVQVLGTTIRKKTYRWRFLIFMQNVSFSFLPFLNLGTQIKYPQNWYTKLKSLLDQPLIKMKWEAIFISLERCSKIRIQKIENFTLKLFAQCTLPFVQKNKFFETALERNTGF